MDVVYHPRCNNFAVEVGPLHCSRDTIFVGDFGNEADLFSCFCCIGEPLPRSVPVSGGSHLDGTLVAGQAIDAFGELADGVSTPEPRL